MRPPRRPPIVVALFVAILAGCGAPPPSAPPSPSPTAATGSSRDAAGPQTSPTTSPPVAYVPVHGSVVVTVTDRLRVRSEPRVSDNSVKYDPVLPIGTTLFVLDGPVNASGYTWYKVAPVSFAELAGPGNGWVAIADKDGQAWIGPAGAADAGLSLALADVPRAPADPAAAQGAAASINAFGLDLERRLVTDPTLDLRDRNMVFSPTSIVLALAMARAGAKGETATQMDKVIHAQGWDSLAAGVNALDQALASRNASWNDGDGPKSLTLRLANAPFGQQGWTIEPAYLDALASSFGAGLRSVDYAADPASARRTINAWVSDRTARRIPELLTPDDVPSSTRLMLVNAIYFKAQWDRWFDEDEHQACPLHPPRRFAGRRPDDDPLRRPGAPVCARRRLAGDRASLPGARRCASAGDDASILPTDLPAFENGLTSAKLKQIAASVAAGPKAMDCPGVPADQQDAGCYAYDLTLSMPRFGIETRANLDKILIALGMPLAFATAADFSGIHTPGPLYIGTVIHQANIDVDEKGTEAAAATAVGMDTGGGPSPVKQIALHLDHPFLFFVRDLDTGRRAVHGSSHGSVGHQGPVDRKTPGASPGSSLLIQDAAGATRVSLRRASPRSDPRSRPRPDHAGSQARPRSPRPSRSARSR